MKADPDITPRYLTEKQAQQYTSLSRDALRQLRIQGLPFIQTKPGAKVFYDREDIDRFLNTFKCNI